MSTRTSIVGFVIAVLTSFGGSASAAEPDGRPPVAATPSSSEQPVAEEGRGFRIGGYGGPLMAVSAIRGEAGVLVGGRGGVLLARRLALGGEGFGLVNTIAMPAGAPGAGRRIDFGGGGVFAQLDWAPDWPVHPVTGVMIGGGSVGQTTRGRPAARGTTRARCSSSSRRSGSTSPS